MQQQDYIQTFQITSRQSTATATSTPYAALATLIALTDCIPSPKIFLCLLREKRLLYKEPALFIPQRNNNWMILSLIESNNGNIGCGVLHFGDGFVFLNFERVNCSYIAVRVRPFTIREAAQL